MAQRGRPGFPTHVDYPDRWERPTGLDIGASTSSFARTGALSFGLGPDRRYADSLGGRLRSGRRAEREQCYQESAEYAHVLNSSGQYLTSAPLYPTSTATSVRVRDGRRLVTDGPFAETREQLGGFFLIGAQDLDEALGIAAKIPAGRWGTVEVRPVIEVPSLRKIHCLHLSIWRMLLTMPSVTETAPASKTKSWVGRVMSGLIVLFLVLDSVMNIIQPTHVVEASKRLGLPLNLTAPIGMVLLVCTMLYAIPVRLFLARSC